MEGEYAKIERLLEIREGVLDRMKGVDGEIRTEREVSDICEVAKEGTEES